MVRTRTLFLDFAKLSQVKGGEVVLILAMVGNDLAVANSAMSRLPARLPISLQHMRRGIQMYFSRMQCAHLCEGMKAIELVSKLTRDPKTAGMYSHQSRFGKPGRKLWFCGASKGPDTHYGYQPVNARTS
jgi:hypothetical protein